MASGATEANVWALSQPWERIAVAGVEHDSVRYLEAAGNYVRVHAGCACHLVRGTLAGLTGELGDRLVRVHRSYALRLTEIVEIRRPDGNDPTAYLTGGEEIPIGRTYWPELERRLRSDP